MAIRDNDPAYVKIKNGSYYWTSDKTVEFFGLFGSKVSCRCMPFQYQSG